MIRKITDAITSKLSPWNIASILVLTGLVSAYSFDILAGVDALLVLAFFVVIYSMRVNTTGFFDDSISRESTAAINGIFILLIFFTHASGYMNMSYEGMPILYTFRSLCRQLVVTTFLFYSGYGILESIKRKGVEYVNKLPLGRIFPLWIKFALAICVFALLLLVFGKDLTPIRFISALVSWGEVGNSNWYVTAILSLYAISWLSFKLFAKQQLRLGVLATFILSIVLVLVFMHFRGHDATYAYNTILCFPAGMIFSLYKDPLEKLFVKNIFTWAFSLSASALIFLVSYRLCTHFSFAFNFLLYQVMAISFPVMFTIFSLKVKIYNPVLHYLGGPALFSLYILMRIPMNILSWTGVVDISPGAFVLISIGATLVLGEVFTKVTDLFLAHLNKG